MKYLKSYKIFESGSDIGIDKNDKIKMLKIINKTFEVLESNISKVFNENGLEVTFDNKGFDNDDGGMNEWYWYDQMSETEMIKYLVDEDANLKNIKLLIGVYVKSRSTELIDLIASKLSDKYIVEPSEKESEYGSILYVNYHMNNVTNMLNNTFNQVNEEFNSPII